MLLHLILPASWAVAVIAASTTNPCLQGTIGKLQYMKDEPCVQLYCSRQLWPATWKLRSPDWVQTIKTCNYPQVESSLNSQLGYQADAYCKCAKGLSPPCPSGKVRTSDYSTCICDIGAFDNGRGGCSSCTNPKIPSADRKTCVCPSTLDTFGSTCLAKCRSDQVRNSNGQCTCDSSKEQVNGVCMTKCRSDQVRNVSTGQCVCKGINSEEVSGACVAKCSSTQERVNGACVAKCRTDQIRNTNGQCACDSTKEEVSGLCVAKCGQTQERYQGSCVAKCRTDQVRNMNGQCACDSTKEEVSGTCITKCGTDQERVGGICTALCRSDQMRDSQNVCTCKSAQNEEFNGACVAKCGTDQERVAGVCKAKCRSDQDKVRDSNGQCQCSTGAREFNEICQQRPSFACGSATDPYTVADRSFHRVCQSSYTTAASRVGSGPAFNFGDCLDQCAQDPQCKAMNWNGPGEHCDRFAESISESRTSASTDQDRAFLIDCRQDQTFDFTSGQCKCIVDGQVDIEESCQQPPATSCADLSDPYVVGEKSFHKLCNTFYALSGTSVNAISFKNCIDQCATNDNCIAIQWVDQDRTCDLLTQTRNRSLRSRGEHGAILLNCRKDQIYDVASGQCKCPSGQGEVNSACVPLTCSDLESPYTSGHQYSLLCKYQYDSSAPFDTKSDLEYTQCIDACEQAYPRCQLAIYSRTTRQCKLVDGNYGPTLKFVTDTFDLALLKCGDGARTDPQQGCVCLDGWVEDGKSCKFVGTKCDQFPTAYASGGYYFAHSCQNKIQGPRSADHQLGDPQAADSFRDCVDDCALNDDCFHAGYDRLGKLCTFYDDYYAQDDYSGTYGVTTLDFDSADRKCRPPQVWNPKEGNCG